MPLGTETHAYKSVSQSVVEDIYIMGRKALQRSLDRLG